MTNLIPVGALLLTALLLAGYWHWRRQRTPTAGDDAHAPGLGWAADSHDPLPLTQRGGEQLSMHELRRRFFLSALAAEPPLDGQWKDEDPTHQTVVAAVAGLLERTDLSARYTPRRPQLLPQLIQSINDSAASSRSIAAIIGKDAVLTGNLLRIANSSLYRMQPREVDSLERAVTLVGTQGVRQIISAALMQPVMRLQGDAAGRFSAQIWDYALRISVAAADHARSIEREDGFTAQLMGLLHGLGAVVVMQAAHDVYARHPQLTPSPLALLELLERYSVPTAARIARSWELSSLVFRGQRDGELPHQHGRELALQRSLYFGQTAAALAMLARAGKMEDGTALATLQAQVPEHVAQWIWKRLRDEAVDAITT
jgi:HD-like signal output (HDOD) protein